MSDTPTPRTDANCFSVMEENPDPYQQDHNHHSGGDYVRAAFARELERENARLKEELNDLIEGRRVILPKNEKHARQMVLVAEACLNFK